MKNASQNLLKSHFYELYKHIAGQHLVPEAVFERLDNGLLRVVTGIPNPCFNGILETSSEPADRTSEIEKQCQFFAALKLPFVWVVDEKGQEAMQAALTVHNFQSMGIFQGLIGPIKKSSAAYSLPSGYSLHRIDSDLTEFGQVMCENSGIEGETARLYCHSLMLDFQQKRPQMAHWAIKKDQAIVSVASTFSQDQAVSFWNVATVKSHRKQGLSSTLCQYAIDQAFQEGAKLAMTYLMPSAMALSVFTRAGLVPEWRFELFASP